MAPQKCLVSSPINLYDFVTDYGWWQRSRYFLQVIAVWTTIKISFVTNNALVILKDTFANKASDQDNTEN